MDPDLTRVSLRGSEAVWGGFFGVRLTVFRTASAAGFFTRGTVDAIGGGGGGGGAAILGVSGGGNGAIIGGGGGTAGMDVRTAAGGGGGVILGFGGGGCCILGGVRRAVLVAALGARGAANFLRGALGARCLICFGGVSTTRGAARGAAL